MQDLLIRCINKGNKLIKSDIILRDDNTESYFSDVILYLIRLYKTTKDSLYLDKVEEMGNSLNDFIKSNQTINYGFYKGRMKSYYALSKINEISKKKYTITFPNKDLENFAKYIYSPNNLYNGKAGTLISLLYIYNIDQQETTLNKIKEYIESILNNVSFSKEGIYWDYTYHISKGLCGLGEGNSGIGFALLELGRFFNIHQLKELGELALKYEDNHWDEKEMTWANFKIIAEGEKDYLSLKEEYLNKGLFPITKHRQDLSWIEGITGMGLARLRAYQITKKEIYLQYIDKIYTKLLSINNLSVEEIIDSVFFCTQVGNSINDSKYYDLAKMLIEKLLNENNLEDTIKLNDVFLQFINPELESYLYPIIKNGISSTAINFDDHFVKRKVTKKAFNITTQIFERKYAQQLHDLYSKIDLYQLNDSVSFIEETINQLDDKHLKDIFQFEKKKLALIQTIENISELFIKEVIHRQEVEYLFNLDEDQFNQECLIINPNLFLLETKWDWWTIEDPRIEGFIDLLDNLNKPPKEHYAIMMTRWDTENPVYTRSLTTFSDLLLENFHSPTTIKDGMDLFLNSFEVKTEEKKEELKKLGQDIIEALFESGILLISKKK